MLGVVMDFLKTIGIEPVNAGAQIGHKWQSKDESKTITSFSPIHGEAISQVTLCSEQDYQTVIEGAQNAFLEWREVPAPKRGDVVRQMGDALRKHKDALGSLVSLEMGKSKQEGDGEVQEMIDIADFAVGQSRMMYGNTMHSEREQHRMYEQWHPYGVVGIISAFNFPVAVWAWNAFLAAICGNACVWKPSEKTPLTAVAVQHICNQVLIENDCPAIFSYFVTDNIPLAETFVKDTRLPLISFTGSTKTGRHVAQIVAERLASSILELGGNNALIVDETADLKLAIPAIVFGAVGTAGQRCTSTRRVFIHESRYEEVLEKIVSGYKQVTIGDPLDTKNLMGPLIDAGSVEQFETSISKAINAGGSVAFGGKKIEGNGFYVEPTIIAGLTNDAEIVQHETFAPILYVMSYSDLNQAIGFQNGVRQGLSSALFTKDLQHAERFLSVLGSDCGIANINIGTSGAEIGGAFGGEKDTGGGRESGSDAWKGYMRRQTNTINYSTTMPLAQGIEFNLG